MLTGTCHCGKVHWTFEGDPDGATACNCTLCRRYGALWIYGYEGQGIRLTGPVAAYTRAAEKDPALEILFCPACGNVAAWRGLRPHENGFKRMAVNVRLSDPDTVAGLPIDHFDGFDTFDDLGRDGRCVRDMWF